MAPPTLPFIPETFKVEHAERTPTEPLEKNSRESLIVVSDLHLGNDLNEHNAGTKKPRRSTAIDDDFVAMIAHYESAPLSVPGKTRRLVIAGDFIDFVGMAVLADGRTVSTEPNEEERQNGLGSTEDHARLKLKLVAARHRKVFEALAHFVATGHSLTIVRGNHDIDFHWESVKEEFRSQLLSLARACPDVAPLDEVTFLSRVEFREWFYYVGGVAYIEHGHQYDALCATEYVMAPMSHGDPRRTARAFSDILLRFVVRRTPNLREAGHHLLGVSGYVRFAIGLGARGLFQLAARFASAVLELFRLRTAHLTSAAATLRAEHEHRMNLLAEATHVGIERLRALASLQVAPVTQSVRGILASVLLDRLAIGLGASVATVCVALLGFRHGYTWASLAAILVAWSVAQRHLERHRRLMFGAHLDPAETLVERAGRLAHLFPAAFVVMGHTHAPQSVSLKDSGSHYVNLGSWSEEEASDEGAAKMFRASRTHLVIEPGDEGASATFFRWTENGPAEFEVRAHAEGAKALPALPTVDEALQRDS